MPEKQAFHNGPPQRAPIMATANNTSLVVGGIHYKFNVLNYNKYKKKAERPLWRLKPEKSRIPESAGCGGMAHTSDPSTGEGKVSGSL